MTPEEAPLRSTRLRAIVVTSVVAVVVALSFVLVRGQIVVLALFGAMIIGEALRPAIDRLSSRMPRAAAVAFSFAVLLVAIAGVWFFPIHALMPQAAAFWNDLPAYAADAAARIADFSRSDPERAKIVAAISASAGATLGPVAEGFLHLQAGLGGVLSTLGLMFVMAVFWLGSSARLMPFVLSIVPQEQRENALGLFREIGDKLGLYVIDTIVNGAMVALECTVLLALLGTPFPIVLGLLQGLLIAIPYLGTLIGVLTVGGVVLATQGWVRAAEAILLVSLAQTIQGTFISPLIFKKGMDLDPLFTVFAIAIGGALFGVFGIVLAVPAASIVQTVVVRVVAPEIRSSHADLSSGGVQ